MNEQESSPSISWVLRTHFSRPVCYRSGTCDPTVATCLNPELPFSVENIRDSFLHKEAPNLGCRKSQDLTAAALSELRKNEETQQSEDFSFPSPFSSSSQLSRVSTASSLQHSKNALDCASPCSDDERGADGAQPARTSCSDSQGFLRSMLNSLSLASSRWSASSDSIGRNHDHSPNSSLKGSWFGWLSPKASPQLSPKVTPTTSPRTSFRHSTTSRDYYTSDKDDGVSCENRSEIYRVPSWSQHLSIAGNERAVLSAQQWMVDLSQLFLGERFACGNHSRLYHGKYKDSPVAVKVIQQPDEDSLLSDRLEQIFTNEVTMLSLLQHRNIIKFFAACKKPPVLCIITEYLSGGSLRSFLHKREGQLLPIGEVLRMALNIASGMECLHMKGIIHRDLKSENLVLGENGVVKILDFGVSCFESCCDFKADDPGTYRWMAPEMLRHKPYTKMVDVYSFGIVLWELLTARVPYEEMGAVQAAFCVLHKDTRPEIPADCPPALGDLMRRCWSVDPNKRPEFWEIMRSLTLCEQSLLNAPAISSFESPQHYSSLPSWLRQ